MKFTYTLPNILTLFRLVLVPVIIYFILSDSVPNMLLAFIFYGLSALTDYFDGKLARHLNQKSEFGEHFDPLADKILIWCVFTALSFKAGLFIPLWLILFLLVRDIYVTWLRSYSRKKNVRFKTSMIAKVKTMVQMVVAAAIIAYIFITLVLKDSMKLIGADYMSIWKAALPGSYYFIVYIPVILTYLTVIFTIYTAFDYYISYKRSVKNG
jgi:CDP-diacylglycerol--glycerol-3-phosphate 3-phosphatidyltransferase